MLRVSGNDIFTQNYKYWYSLRKIYEFPRPQVKSLYQGGKSVSFLGPKIWYVDRWLHRDNISVFKKIKIKMET